MRYKYSYKDATKIHKHGIDLALYGEEVAGGGLVLVDVKVGHLEEFYHDKSTFTYIVLEGHGTFVLNDEKIEVGPKDMIVAPPNTRIYYFGEMKLVLCTTPKWEAEHEHHVRIVNPSESPYAK